MFNYVITYHLYPHRRDVVEQHYVAPQPFRTPSTNYYAAPPSTVDTGGLGLSSKPPDNTVEKRFFVREAWRRHGHGGRMH